MQGMARVLAKALLFRFLVCDKESLEFKWDSITASSNLDSRLPFSVIRLGHIGLQL